MSAVSLVEALRATTPFSKEHDLYRHCTRYSAWPFLTPDGEWVVFALGACQHASGASTVKLATSGPRNASAGGLA